jgi:hypothetical protein
MITSKSSGSTRRTTPQRGGATGADAARGGRGRRTGVPSRALADGVVERRRTRRPAEVPAPTPELAESTTMPRSARDHYRTELQRRANRMAGDLQTLLAEAKAEYEAHLAAPRAAGKGGRPRKKPLAKDEFDLKADDALGPEADE